MRDGFDDMKERERSGKWKKILRIFCFEIEVEVDCGDILDVYIVQQFAKSMSFVVILQRHKSNFRLPL